ncbi:MAG: WhiB family transcriptional regulator [Mycobacteriaceae bacterium]|nr:WhiB family transcriptional regulator [Mycobacteriaceae bacterium]
MTAETTTEASAESAAVPSATLLGACTQDPDRWASATEADEGATAICRACPWRWECAREACELPGVQGIWAGVFVPEAGRPRTFALRQLRSLADHGARSVRP